MGRKSKWVGETTKAITCTIPLRLYDKVLLNEGDFGVILAEAIVRKYGSGGSDPSKELQSLQYQLDMINKEIALIELTQRQELSEIQEKKALLKVAIESARGQLEARDKTQKALKEAAERLKGGNYYDTDEQEASKPE